MSKVRHFEASVSYQKPTGQHEEESFPVRAHDYETARRMALSHVLNVLKYKEFELRIVGS
jgi:hypothetical protein